MNTVDITEPVMFQSPGCNIRGVETGEDIPVWSLLHSNVVYTILQKHDLLVSEISGHKVWPARG